MASVRGSAFDHRDVRFILALCAGWFGLQQILTVFYASGYFYLASLGFSNAKISLIWLSGPLAGMFFQPIIGAMSDNCTYAWGRRRPFVVVGTIGIICAMLSLAWAEEITGFLDMSRASHRLGNKPAPGLLLFAAACVVTANFAIQPVQLGLRAMIVDLVPVHQQAQAHAWVAKLNLAGSIVGYSIGSLNLTGKLTFLGETQMQVLCSIVSINLAVCVAITCWSTDERRNEMRLPGVKKRLSLQSCLRDLTVTRQVCTAQLFAWFAWFPFMYYMAKYVGSFQRLDASAPSGVSGVTARTGSFAMLIFACVSLLTTFVIAETVQTLDSAHPVKRTGASYLRVFSLRHLWLAGQVLFFICMMLTFVVSNVTSAYVLVAITGLPWATGTWIPFALISQDIRQPRNGVLGADVRDYDELAATVVGIHNSAICAPQIAAGLVSSLFFHFAAQEAGSEVWLLRVGGLSALVAAWIIRRLPDTSRPEMGRD